MDRRRILIMTAAALFVAATLLVILTPLIVASGLRLWAERVARREGFQLQLDQIEAPLFRPVVIRNLRVESGTTAPFRVHCVASGRPIGVSILDIITGGTRLLRCGNVERVALF